MDNFVHKLFTSFLIYYHAFYRVIFIVVFHMVKIKFLANN
ncbi:membrane protein [Escherichia albertii KF1]|nr:membrane protein [Escherichia albertii KF1]